METIKDINDAYERVLVIIRARNDERLQPLEKAVSGGHRAYRIEAGLDPEPGAQYFGSFKTFDEARLAGETDNALRGGTSDIEWLPLPYLMTEPEPSHFYILLGPTDDGKVWAAYVSPGEIWERTYDTHAAAQQGCESDINARFPVA